MEKKILITGASGFIGSFMVEEGLRQGMQVWAGVRHSSSRKYLQDTRIRFAELDFTDSDTLEKQLAEHRREHGGWDYIIHCAGVTKCLHRGDFEIANHWGTRHFIETLQRQGITPKRFVYLSSLSVFGPVHEKDYSDICDKDVPSPNTAYGISKLHAEEYLRSLPDFPYVILRPTGVYGPREHDYFLMMKSTGRTRELDDRALAFMHKFNDRIMVIDPKDYGMDELGELSEYLDAFFHTNVIRVFNNLLADVRNHPLSVRRYMWKFAY